MADISPSQLYGPGGFQDNRYVKTSQYQAVKIIRMVFGWLGLAARALITLVKDVVRGLVGR